MFILWSPPTHLHLLDNDIGSFMFRYYLIYEYKKLFANCSQLTENQAIFGIQNLNRFTLTYINWHYTSRCLYKIHCMQQKSSRVKKKEVEREREIVSSEFVIKMSFSCCAETLTCRY